MAYWSWWGVTELTPRQNESSTSPWLHSQLSVGLLLWFGCKTKLELNFFFLTLVLIFFCESVARGCTLACAYTRSHTHTHTHTHTQYIYTACKRWHQIPKTLDLMHKQTVVPSLTHICMHTKLLERAGVLCVTKPPRTSLERPDDRWED